jgi:hypothetical protein
MTLLLLLLGCASPDDLEVHPTWYVHEAECVDSVATWAAPEGVALLTIRRTSPAGVSFYGSEGIDADGMLSVACTDDVTILYAVVEQDVVE